MSAPAIIARRDALPSICFCCGRASFGVGVHEPRHKTRFAWICDNPECIKATKAMTATNLQELTRYEARALDAVAKGGVEGVTQDVFNALWDAGVRNLEEMTAEQVEKAMTALIINGAMHDRIKSALLAFGDHIRSDVAGNQAPF